MKSTLWNLLIFALLAPATAALEGAPFYVSSCSLGCTDGSSGAPISCALQNVFSDQQLELTWSEPVDFSSVSLLSIRILDVSTGLTAPGQYALKDAYTVVFTPQASGLDPSVAWLVTIPGTAQGDPGPHVLSTAGVPNLARLSCVFVANLGVLNVQNECTTTANSVGPGACMGWAGFPSLAANAFDVSATRLPADRPAVFVVSNGAGSLPLGNGTLCLSQPFFRLQPVVTTGSAGTLSRPIDWSALPAGLTVAPGQSVWFQLVYRDPAGGAVGFNLSDALRVDLAP